MVNNFPLIHPLLFHLKQFEKRKCEIWIIYIKFYYLPDQLFIYFRIINFFRAITFCLATEIDEAKQFFVFIFLFLEKIHKSILPNFQTMWEQQFFGKRMLVYLDILSISSISYNMLLIVLSENRHISFYLIDI